MMTRFTRLYLTLNNKMIINKSFKDDNINKIDILTYRPPLENLLMLINNEESIALRKHLFNKVDIDDLVSIDDLILLIKNKKLNYELYYSDYDKTLTTTLYDKNVDMSLIIKQGVDK